MTTQERIQMLALAALSAPPPPSTAPRPQGFSPDIEKLKVREVPQIPEFIPVITAAPYPH